MWFIVVGVIGVESEDEWMGVSLTAADTSTGGLIIQWLVTGDLFTMGDDP